jgi:putative hydrolase of the HAD superfamily
VRAPSAILLDALGTLVSLEPPAPRLADELRRRFDIDLSPAEAERAIAAEIHYYRAHHDEGRDRASLAALRQRCARAMGEALPARAGDALSRRDADAAQLAEALLASLCFTAFDDAAPALGALRVAGARLVVASNWDCSLHDVLERLELTPLLDGVVTSAEVGARKPAAAIFERALAVAGAAPAAAIHVGDSLEADVAGARAAGIEPVLIRRDLGPGPPGVRRIGSLAELVVAGCHDPGL